MRKTKTVCIAMMIVFYSSSVFAGVGTVVKAGGAGVRYVCPGYDGYADSKNNTDAAMEDMAVEAVVSAGTIGYGVAAAAINGAGSLAGYAGIASAVSNLGLGGVTTAIAGTMGSSATGAAATALVTSAVGGPVIMGGILIVGTAAASYGIYKGGQAIWRWTSK